MIKAATTRSASRIAAASQKRFSSNPGPLEADAGPLATHTWHTLSLTLSVLAPTYLLLPDSLTDGAFGKAFGVVLAGNVSAHGWIGMNYVATDYVPKLSKKLLPPARLVLGGMAALTFFGLSQISISSKGGIKGCLKGLWNPPKEEKK